MGSSSAPAPLLYVAELEKRGERRCRRKEGTGRGGGPSTGSGARGREAASAAPPRPRAPTNGRSRPNQRPPPQAARSRAERPRRARPGQPSAEPPPFCGSAARRRLGTGASPRPRPRPRPLRAGGALGEGAARPAQDVSRYRGPARHGSPREQAGALRGGEALQERAGAREVRQHGRALCRGEDAAGAGEGVHQGLRLPQRVHRGLLPPPGPVQSRPQAGAGLRGQLHRRVLPQVSARLPAGHGEDQGGSAHHHQGRQGQPEPLHRRHRLPLHHGDGQAAPGDPSHGRDPAGPAGADGDDEPHEPPAPRLRGAAEGEPVAADAQRHVRLRRAGRLPGAADALRPGVGLQRLQPLPALLRRPGPRRGLRAPALPCCKPPGRSEVGDASSALPAAPGLGAWAPVLTRVTSELQRLGCPRAACRLCRCGQAINPPWSAVVLRLRPGRRLPRAGGAAHR